MNEGTTSNGYRRHTIPRVWLKYCIQFFCKLKYWIQYVGGLVSNTRIFRCFWETKYSVFCFLPFSIFVRVGFENEFTCCQSVFSCALVLKPCSFPPHLNVFHFLVLLTCHREPSWEPSWPSRGKPRFLEIFNQTNGLKWMFQAWNRPGVDTRTWESPEGILGDL